MIGILVLASTGLEIARLANGIPVLIEHRPGADTVALCAMLRTDELSLEDARALSAIVDSWYSGTEALTLSRVRSLASETGGRLGIEVATDRLVFSAEVPKESLGLVVSVLTELWLHPDLRGFAAIEGWKERARLDLFHDTPLREQLRTLAQELGWHKETSPQDNTESLESAYSRVFRPEFAAFAVVGDVSSDAVIERLNRSFGSWQGKRAGRPRDEARQTRKKHARAGSFAGVRMDGPPVDSPALAAFVLGVTALMDGKSSVMGRALRYERALSYQFGTLETVKDGKFEVIIFASFDSPERMDGVLLKELQRAVAVLSEDDLRRAKSYLLSQVELGRATTDIGRSLPRGQRTLADAANTHCWWQLFGGGMAAREQFIKAIEAATLAEVRQALLASLEANG